MLFETATCDSTLCQAEILGIPSVFCKICFGEIENVLFICVVFNCCTVYSIVFQFNHFNGSKSSESKL